MTRRLRQVIDLYVTGKVALLADGTTPVWVQALNPFEQDTARSEAMIAKARLSLAIKENGSDERSKVRAAFLEDGLEHARKQVVDTKCAEAMPKILDRIRADSEWTERLLILERGLDDTAKLPEPAEVELLETIAAEYTQEMASRLNDERIFQTEKWSSANEDELWREYLDWYLSRRGGELLIAEFKLHQILFGARWCEAIRDEQGVWHHDECGGHDDRLFPDKDAVRRAPEQLIALLAEAAEDIEMTVREAGKLGQAGEFIRLVSSAKRGGGVDCLYPQRDPARAPWYLVHAVSHALTVLGYHELTDDQRPPEEIWLDQEALTEHFESVKNKLKSRADSGEPGLDMQNEWTKDLRR